MTRRQWLERVATLTAGLRFTGGVRMAQRSAREAVDHLLLGSADLDAGVTWVERLTGVRAVFGGVHPGVGTRNALASLGGRQYLEIIAPDPTQKEFTSPFEVRKLTEPRLITWAASTDDVDAVARAGRAAGFGVFGPRDGSRNRPDGSVLRWRTVAVDGGLSSQPVNLVPFFIQWAADSRHPASDSPAGLRLVALELRHPEPGRVRDVLSKLGIETVVQKSDGPELQATLDTPRGPVTLR